ncbi:unnamed protein product, partial [Symbiodinium microadriaticum]
MAWVSTLSLFPLKNRAQSKCCDYQGLGCGEEFEDSKEKASVAKAAADAAPKAPGEAQSESGSP